jgi:predicted metal-dependent hydrolase
MGAPAWAERILREVARANRRRPPELRWRRSRYRRSAGSASIAGRNHNGSISIDAGRDVVDQRLVLCHELAHWLSRPDENHSIAFWLRAWRLYRRYRVPIYYALAREGKHEGAVLAYQMSLRRGRR